MKLIPSNPLISTNTTINAVNTNNNTNPSDIIINGTVQNDTNNNINNKNE
jgi:hypothetical protein